VNATVIRAKQYQPHCRISMSSLTANTLKTRGVSAIAEALYEASERPRFPSAAIAESQADLEAGRFAAVPVGEHMQRLDAPA